MQGGGLVPVVITTVADSASLSPEDAESLRAKVDDAGLLDASSSVGDPHPDRPSYQITVEGEGGRNQVSFGDAALPDAVRSLIGWINSVPGHEETVGRPGAAASPPADERRGTT